MSISLNLKRNVCTKRNNSGAKSPATQKDSFQSNAPLMLQSTGRGKYRLPQEDEIPADTYVSRIMAATETVTRSGKKAIEVLYKLQQYTECYREVNGLSNCDYSYYYYIKQIYTYGTQFYDEFVDAMANALNITRGNTFTLEQIVGITEAVKLGYYGNSKFGSFMGRCRICYEDLLKKPDNVVDETPVEEEPSDNDQDYNEPPKSSPINEDDDDEFDNFLDGIDDED